MMYDQDTVPTFRRGLWMVLGLIVVVAVLWTVVWLVFFRHPSPKVSTLHGNNASQNQSDNNQPQSSDTGSGGSANSKPNPGAAAANTDQLANAGAGNVLIPFAVASVAGGVLYHIRLRRKLLS